MIGQNAESGLGTDMLGNLQVKESANRCLAMHLKLNLNRLVERNGKVPYLAAPIAHDP